MWSPKDSETARCDGVHIGERRRVGRGPSEAGPEMGTEMVWAHGGRRGLEEVGVEQGCGPSPVSRVPRRARTPPKSPGVMVGVAEQELPGEDSPLWLRMS